MNDQTNTIPTNTFLQNIVEQVTQYIVLRVIENLGAVIDAKIEAAVSASFDATLHDVNHAITEIKANMPTLSSDVWKQSIKAHVQDYLDDNRTLSRMDESLDNLTTRVDDLEAEDGSGMSRKMKDNIENVVQDKLDSSEFVQKDSLSETVAEIISSGSFSFNRY